MSAGAGVVRQFIRTWDGREIDYPSEEYNAYLRANPEESPQLRTIYEGVGEFAGASWQAASTMSYRPAWAEQAEQEFADYLKRQEQAAKNTAEREAVVAMMAGALPAAGVAEPVEEPLPLDLQVALDPPGVFTGFTSDWPDGAVSIEPSTMPALGGVTMAGDIYAGIAQGVAGLLGGLGVSQAIPGLSGVLGAVTTGLGGRAGIVGAQVVGKYGPYVQLRLTSGKVVTIRRARRGSRRRYVGSRGGGMSRVMDRAMQLAMIKAIK